MSEDRKLRQYAKSEITVTRSEDGLNITNTTPWAWTYVPQSPAKDLSVIKIDIPPEPPAGTRLGDKHGWTVQRLHGIKSVQRWQWSDTNDNPHPALESWREVLLNALSAPGEDNKLVYLTPLSSTVGEKADTVEP